MSKQRLGSNLKSGNRIHYECLMLHDNSRKRCQWDVQRKVLGYKSVTIPSRVWEMGRLRETNWRIRKRFWGSTRAVAIVIHILLATPTNISAAAFTTIIHHYHSCWTYTAGYDVADISAIITSLSTSIGAKFSYPSLSSSSLFFALLSICVSSEIKWWRKQLN